MNILAHSPALILAIPLLMASAIPILDRIVNERVRNILIVLSLILTLIFIGILATNVLSSGPWVYVFGAGSPLLTLPSGYNIPVRIIFEIDAMSVFMVIISITVVFAGVIYSLAFMKKETGVGTYYSLLLLLTAGMFGMELTGDIFNFFVFLEITSIAACSLVAFRIERGKSAEAAFKTMVLYTVSALMFLFAIGLLYGQYGALNIGILASKIQYNLLDKIALGIFIAALALKAGAVPMHMWVSDAYPEAPAPISMILVSNSQASLYALFRVCFTLYGLKLSTELIGWIIIILGVLSMFVGVTMALVQKSIKRVMAYHAISQTGYMLLGVGVGLAVLGTPALQEYGIKAMEGGIFHIINHALYKGLLFLTAGAIIYRTGIRNLDEMGGLAHKMKYTAIFFIIGAAAITGLPPFNGFVSKLIIYESVYRFNPVLSIIAILVSILTLASFVKVFQGAFLGPRLRKFENVREVPTSMFISMLILSIIIILFGIFPDIVIKNLVEPAVYALVNQDAYISAIIR